VLSEYGLDIRSFCECSDVVVFLQHPNVLVEARAIVNAQYLKRPLLDIRRTLQTKVRNVLRLSVIDKNPPLGIRALRV
jgi:hypothetical protein